MQLKRFLTIICAAAGLSAAAQYHPPMVVEEGTGEWCKFCVRGIYAFREMSAAHPESFIGIAIHDNDEFAMSEYVAMTGIQAFPGCNINRIYRSVDVTLDLFNMAYEEMVSKNSPAAIGMTAALEGDEVVVNTVTTVGADMEGAVNVAVVLIENHLPGLYQINAYAGTDVQMGGFENLPDKIPYPIFNHVARCIYPQYQGEKIADSPAAGATIENTFRVPVPQTVKAPDNLTAIALLLYNGIIANAAEVPLFNQVAALPEVVAVDCADKVKKGETLVVTVDVKNAVDANTYSYLRVLVDNGTVVAIPTPVTLRPDMQRSYSVTVPAKYFKSGIHNLLPQLSIDGDEWTDACAPIAVTVDDGDALTTVSADTLDPDVEVYNLQGVRVGRMGDALPAGLYISAGRKIIIR